MQMDDGRACRMGGQRVIGNLGGVTGTNRL
jgi:hypothetical protein